MQKIIDEIKKTEQEFTEIRHTLHQHPELGFEETFTSNFIVERLKEYGYTVDQGMAKTGVVGTLKVGNSNKVIGLRADIDALPITETSGKAWTSKTDGKLHGCGHDGHTAMLLCAAKYLAQTKNFDGTIHLIFQPAEELLYGGRVMLEDGLFKKFPCDAIFGLHNMPGIKLNEFNFRHGAFMASADTLHIEITGLSSHGAMPEGGIDATMVACYIGTALQTIVSRNITPFAQAVVTVGCIEAGQAPNVVNGKALMKLSMRSLNSEVRDCMKKRIHEIAKLQAESFGATVKIEHIHSSPVLVNGDAMTDFSIKVAQDMFGTEMVNTEAKQLMGSEDFAFMLEENPNGCYVFLGAGFGPNVHNDKYDFNDENLVVGASYWAGLTETYLKK